MAPPLLSVLTAASRGDLDWLDDAAASLPSALGKHSFEWVIAVDRLDDDALARISKRYDAIVLRSPAPGPATARNAAFARSTGTYVVVLDDDDVLLPGTGVLLSRLLETGRHWGCSTMVDLAHHAPLRVLEDRLVPAGEPARAWISGGMHPWPHAAAPTVISAVSLAAAGGWPAVARGEDLLMLTHVTSLYDGVYVSAPGYAYRRHPGQVSSQDWFVELIPQCVTLMRRRIDAFGLPGSAPAD